MRSQIEDDREWLSNLEATEDKKRVLLLSKLVINLGFYISLPRSKASQAPAYFIKTNIN